jgi:hypothetical protein
MADEFPLVMTAAGPVPTPPAEIRAALIALVSATNPGYAANLPGALIEDISSTDVAAVALIDSARIELINSLTPLGANAFLLAELGEIYGPKPGETTNTSAFVTFAGPPGFVISQGFVVSDGAHQYLIKSGGIIASNGFTALLYCVASLPGSWAVLPNSINQTITSVPAAITAAGFSVTNPQAGTPSPGAETEEAYRSRVLQAGLAASQGMSRYMKTLLGDIDGVQTRLLSVRQVNGGGWQVICGGGDPYEVAYAIYSALFDISTLVGSTISVTGITKANPGVVTTDLNHGLVTGQANVFLSGVLGMTAANGGPYTVTVIDQKTFSFGVNTTGFGTYTTGGAVTPNSRNVVVDINDYPDVYAIPYINPPQQTVSISLLWNTTSPFAVSSAAVNQLGTPALVDYVNALPTGVPMNLFELQDAFKEAVSTLVPPQLLTRMAFSVSINGIGTAPSAGTGIIAGDPESYFNTLSTLISINQG